MNSLKSQPVIGLNADDSSLPKFQFGQTVERKADANLGIVVGMKKQNEDSWEYSVWYPELKALGLWESEENLGQLLFVEQVPLDAVDIQPCELTLACV